MDIFPKHKTLILTIGSHAHKQSVLTRYSNESASTCINVQSKQNIFQHTLHHQDNIRDKNIIINNIPPTLDNYYQAEIQFKDHAVMVLYFTGQPNPDEEEIIDVYRKSGLLREIAIDSTKSIEDNYKLFRKSLLSNLIFVGGAPRSGKTKFAQSLANTLGYRYMSLQQFTESLRSAANSELSEVSVVNKLISSLSCCHDNYVIDGLFQTTPALSILTQYSSPVRIFYFQASNDQIESEIQSIKDVGLKKEKKKEFQEFLSWTDTVVGFLNSKSYFVRVNGSPEENQRQIHQLTPQVLYVSEFEDPLIGQLAKRWGGTHLDLQQLIRINAQRNKKEIGSNSSISHKIAYLKKITANLNGKIVLSRLSEKLCDLIEFEKNVAQIKLYFKQAPNEQNTQYKEIATPQMYYLRQQKLISLEKNSSPALFLSYLDTRNPYILISGPETSGKTEVSKIISRDYGYKHIDYKTYIQEFKEKYPNQSGEEHTPTQITAHFKRLINEKRENKYIIEGLPFQKGDYLNWVKEVGSPTLVNIRVDDQKWLQRYRASNSIDQETEITEEDQERITNAQTQNTNYMNNINEILETVPSIKLFQLDCNIPLISLENFISLIFKPRIYLVAEQKDASNVLYLNIAIKHNFGFFDLATTDLRTVCQKVSNHPHQRDIILYNYSAQDQLVGQNIHFIENNIGTVRFVGVWGKEQKDFKDPLMKLERPIVEKKKKVAEEGAEKQEGDEEEQPPAEQQANQEQQLDENGEPIKPKLDIYNFEWTQTGNEKNLSQWFLQSKSFVKEFIFEKSNPKQVYDDFELIVRELNRDKNSNAYLIIQ